MDSWQKDLVEKRKDAEEKLQKIEEEQKTFLSQNIVMTTQNEQRYLEIIKIIYEMLVLTAKQSLCQIEQEIEKLKKLMNYRAGSDSVIDK